MMRVMSFLCCVAAIILSIIGLNKPQTDYSGLCMLITAFLGAAFGGKVLQKRIEIDGSKAEQEVSSRTNQN